MNSVNLKDGCFQVNGKKQFILSGEVQYFRIEKNKWRKMLDGLCEANCNTLSTYVPWNWHEYEQGKFDFTGKTHPSRDLVSFLKLVKEYGLNLIIKGGPHIHAEFLNGGIPKWVLSGYPEVLCLDSEGKPTGSYAFYPPVTYLHPTYMQLVKKWYEAFTEVVLPFDNIILWQVDNEVSYSLSFFHYSPGQAFSGDYNPFLVEKNGLYQQYLSKKFKDIKDLNARYGENNTDFTLVSPPRKEPSNKEEQFKVFDWCEFREKLVAMYVRSLMEMLFELGCRGPFSVDDPLLGYDTSWKGIYDEVKDSRWQVVIGYTYYTGNMEEESMGYHLSRIEFTRASGTPVVSNHEIQAGNVYFLPHWKQSPSDYDLIWKTSIGFGSNMLNFYWFCDGYNFLGYEHFLPKMNFSSPLDKDGNKRFQFGIIKKIGEMLKKYPEIVETKPDYDLAVGYYHPYARMGKFSNLEGVGNFELSKGGAVGSFIDLLGVCNINFQMLNLEENIKENIFACPSKLVVLCYEFLDKNIQKSLLDYVSAGGHLILLNQVPLKDENLGECKMLYDALKIARLDSIPKGKGFFEINRVGYKNYDFCVYDDLQIYEFNDRDYIQDMTSFSSGRICGFTRNVGGGKISVVGFVPRVFLDVSRNFARDYFEKKSRDGILVYERKNKDFSLFTACNLSEKEEKIEMNQKQFILPPRRATFIVKKGENYEKWGEERTGL
ncbi:beta-galactosidase [bacterium]|nr:beta-galactosidase [bacterium]